MTTSIYLAGPVRNVPDSGAGWRDSVIAWFPTVEWLNPLNRYDVPAGSVSLRKGDEFAADAGVVTVGELVGHDKQLLDRADGVLVGYSDVKQIGTPMEVMWAADRDKPVALWVRDDTPFDEVSPWYRHHATCVTSSRSVAIEHLRREVTD